MGAEETVHRQKLTELFQKKFGGHIPLIRRQDVKGFVQRKPLWLVRPLGLEAVRRFTASMELETRQFYEKAASRTADPDIRRLLDDLAQVERRHEINAERLSDKYLNKDARAVEAAAQRRLYALQIIQPGLAGLMDGSVSTLAPVFAAAAATHDSWQAFLVGLAASLGAGISMGFAEALSDDGQCYRPRPPLGARPGLRPYDHAGRHRPHPAVSYRQLPGGAHGGAGGGGAGAGRHYLGAFPLHEHAHCFRGPAGGAGRGAGLSDRTAYRQRLRAHKKKAFALVVVLA